jgi:hypothetical protein
MPGTARQRRARIKTRVGSAVQARHQRNPRIHRRLTGVGIRVYSEKRASRIKGIPNFSSPARSLTKSLNYVLIDDMIL